MRFEELWEAEVETALELELITVLEAEVEEAVLTMRSVARAR